MHSVCLEVEIKTSCHACMFKKHDKKMFALSQFYPHTAENKATRAQILLGLFLFLLDIST